MPVSRDDFIIAIRYALLKKGAKQKFSLFFLIFFSILVIFLDKLSVPFMLSTRAVLNDIVYQVTVIASQPGKFLSYLDNVGTKHYNIVKKNITLEAELEKLKSERYNNLFLKTENKNLKYSLNIENIMAKEEGIVITAKVIIDSESPYLKSLLINQGKNKGVIKGMTVFSNGNLIGRIIESNFLSARVLLITDLNSKIPVIIQDTNVNGILTGSGNRTDLNLEYLPDEFVIEPNKIIFTSGKDGTLTAGMPVAETYLNKKGRVQIKSLANPTQALIVHVTRGQLNR
jgi:rod shape-determining protein MreC